MEDLLINAKKDTRGVLLSKIGGVPLERFNRDYRDLLGRSFPYRDLGFTDLRSSLESMDDTVRFEFTDDKWMLFGVADDHSFMSSPAIKAQFAQDKPIRKQRNRQKRNFQKKKSSDSDDSKGTRKGKRSKNDDLHHEVNGQPSETLELLPNMKGLYSICIPRLPITKSQEVIQLFSEVASQEEDSRSTTHLFLRYKTREEAEEIIARFDGYLLNDLQLTVQPAIEKKAKGGRTDKKSRSPVPIDYSRGTLPNSSSSGVKKEQERSSLLKEESSSFGSAASSKTPCNTQNGMPQRASISLTNGNKTRMSSPRQPGTLDSHERDAALLLPWTKSQLVNGNALDSNDHMLINRKEAGACSESRVEKAVFSSALPNAYSSRTISKPSLPSILDIADRLKSTKM